MNVLRVLYSALAVPVVVSALSPDHASTVELTGSEDVVPSFQKDDMVSHAKRGSGKVIHIRSDHAVEVIYEAAPDKVYVYAPEKQRKLTLVKNADDVPQQTPSATKNNDAAAPFVADKSSKEELVAAPSAAVNVDNAVESKESTSFAKQAVTLGALVSAGAIFMF